MLLPIAVLLLGLQPADASTVRDSLTHYYVQQDAAAVERHIAQDFQMRQHGLPTLSNVVNLLLTHTQL